MIREIDRDEVHIWRLDLDRADPGWPPLLDRQERRRAAAFARARERDRFISCHGQVREILARYAGRAAADLEYAHAAGGKPALASALDDGELHFNISHCGALGLLAVTRHGEVGIDVERVRDDLDILALAERYFAPAPRRELAGLPEAMRPQHFFVHWTRMEAIAKASGAGLARLLDGDANAHCSAGRHCTCYDFVPADGYVAALAVDGEAPGLRPSYFQGGGSPQRSQDVVALVGSRLVGPNLPRG